MIEGLVQGALRKELLIAPFVEHLKAATLGKSYWEIVPVLGTVYLTIAFLSIFRWKNVMHRSLYEKNYLLLYSQSALKQLLWESLSDNFQQYFEQNA